MTDKTPASDPSPVAASDWIKAALLIALIVGIVILVFMLGIGQFSGCGTRAC